MIEDTIDHRLTSSVWQTAPDDRMPAGVAGIRERYPRSVGLEPGLRVHGLDRVLADPAFHFLVHGTSAFFHAAFSCAVGT